MGERNITLCICDYIKTPIDKIKGTTTRYIISLFPLLPLAYESLASGINMPWYNTISNWATHFAKLFSCDHNNPERMIDSELHSYTRHTDDENHSLEQESSSTMCAEHASGRNITKSKETILHNFKQQKHIMQKKIKDERNENSSAEQKLNSDVDGAQRTNDGRRLQPADNQNFIPEELISSINNMVLTLPNISQDQAPGPSHRNNVDIDYHTTSTVDDIQFYCPPRHWLHPRKETSSQRQVYSNKKHPQGKRDFSGIDLNIPETGCDNSNINVIVCRPPQNWVNAIEESRQEQVPVYHAEFFSQKSKPNVANPMNQESGSNIPSCSHDKQKPMSKETETLQHRLPQQVTHNTKQDIVQADSNVDDSEHYQVKLSKLDNHQPSEKIKEQVTAAASVISALKRDSHDNELKPKRAKNSDDQRQKEEELFIVPETQQKELEPVRIRTSDIQSEDRPIPKKMLRAYRNTFHGPSTSTSNNCSISIAIENHEQNFIRSSRKRTSDTNQHTNQPKRRTKALLVEIITKEILNNFERNLEESDLTPYERNYLGRIYDILKKCKEFENKLDLLNEELDEQRLYYFEENLQRNMEKLDRIDPQESKILGEKRKDVIKYIYKIIEKLEDKPTVKLTIE